MRNTSQIVRDTEFVSTEDHYKFTHELSKKLENLTFGDFKRSRSLTEIFDAEYLANGTQ